MTATTVGRVRPALRRSRSMTSASVRDPLAIIEIVLTDRLLKEQ